MPGFGRFGASVLQGVKTYAQTQVFNTLFSHAPHATAAGLSAIDRFRNPIHQPMHRDRLGDFGYYRCQRLWFLVNHVQPKPYPWQPPRWQRQDGRGLGQESRHVLQHSVQDAAAKPTCGRTKVWRAGSTDPRDPYQRRQPCPSPTPSRSRSEIDCNTSRVTNKQQTRTPRNGSTRARRAKTPWCSPS